MRGGTAGGMGVVFDRAGPLAAFTSRSAADGAKQRFLLKRLLAQTPEERDAPVYPR